LEEAGYPGIDPWYGLFAPAGISPALSNKVREDVASILLGPNSRLVTSMFWDTPASAAGAFANSFGTI
jgi:tripartite-type tricarboxylate transporter receptor subunit TctC